jgi:methylglutaconyl-CoA hydratase
VKKFTCLEIEKEPGLTTVWLSRPDIHNAFNDIMLIELIECIEQLNVDEKNSIVLLRGKGKSFCSGADINWMQGGNPEDYELYYEDSVLLGRCLDAFVNSKKIIISVVHGSVYGGGIGLMASTDLVIAEESTVFSFSEIRLGLIPAMISPYLVRRMNIGDITELMLTAQKFDANAAKTFKLVNYTAAAETLPDKIRKVTSLILKGAPGARSALKKVLNNLSFSEWKLNDYEKLACVLSELRISEEANEGMQAFLQKRKPQWDERS